MKKASVEFLHRLLWPWYLRRFKRVINGGRFPSDTLLKRLVFHWGNSGWSADVTLLKALLRVVTTRKKLNILECGSGLTTVLLAVVAERNLHQLTAFEHQSAWRIRIMDLLEKNKIQSAQVIWCPLRDYGEYDWYALPESLPSPETKFDLVLCDGPPGSTRGGRLGLLYVLSLQLATGCIIFIDDAHRIDEQEIVKRWAKDFRLVEDESISGSVFRVLKLSQDPKEAHV